MIVSKPFVFVYDDAIDGNTTVRGRLKKLDDGGFTVIELPDGKHLIIPKDKFIRMQELDEEEYKPSG